MGLLYAVEMFGLRPDTPDPVAKYWGKSGDDGSNAIMQWLGMSIVWCNGLVLYALTSLGANAVGLQKCGAHAKRPMLDAKPIDHPPDSRVSSGTRPSSGDRASCSTFTSCSRARQS